MTLTEWNAYVRLPIDVVRAEDDTLILRHGRRVLDLYGQHCVLSLGRVSFAPTRLRAIEDMHHLTNAVSYVVGQPAKHARGLDPYFEGSSLHELLGLRVADEGQLGRAIQALAPRFDAASVRSEPKSAIAMPPAMNAPPAMMVMVPPVATKRASFARLTASVGQSSVPFPHAERASS